MRPSTASTISGSASSVAATPSSWRPPWFDTTSAAAPCSHASLPSSAVSTPFTTTGSPASDANRSTSPHVTDGDISSNALCGVTPPWPSDGTASSMRDAEPDAAVALAAAENRCVDGEQQGAEPEVTCLRDHLARAAVVLRHVHLVPAQRAGRDHVGRRGGRHGREAHDRAGRLGRPRHAELAVGVGHALERGRARRAPASRARGRGPSSRSRARRRRRGRAAAAASGGTPRRCRAASTRRSRRRRSSRMRPRRAARRRGARSPRRSAGRAEVGRTLAASIFGRPEPSGRVTDRGMRCRRLLVDVAHAAGDVARASPASPGTGARAWTPPRSGGAASRRPRSTLPEHSESSVSGPERLCAETVSIA